MISNIRKIPKLFLYLLGHWSFLKSINVVKTKQLIIVLFLATLTVLCEAIGLSIIIPILSFIESGNDLEKFKNSSLLTKNVVNIFSFIGIPISLLSMSFIAIFFTLLRQINNYFNRLYTEKLKWTVDKKLQIKIFDVIMSSSTFYIQEFRTGHLANITAIEIPQVAAIFRSYNTIWMIFLTLLAYTIILFLTAPKITIGVLIFISSVLLLSSGFIRLTKKISESNLVYRNHFRDFINEKFSAWKLIRLSNTDTIRIIMDSYYPFKPPVKFYINDNEYIKLFINLQKDIYNYVTVNTGIKCVCCNTLLCIDNWEPKYKITELIDEYTSRKYQVKKWYKMQTLQKILYRANINEQGITRNIMSFI